ncbi:uracil-5--methyltransferase TRM9 [Nemania sp. FL0916]|nr:uracil-5--methyltransferase TRM9 [Nemania sp. FL0916]
MSRPTASHDAPVGAEEKTSVTNSTNNTSTDANTNTNASTNASTNNAIRDAAALSPAAYEEEHVHGVYESIAGHFSSTRYKPWPFIAAFLRERVATGAVGLDVGCGNGKYLGVRASTATSGTGTGTDNKGVSDVHIVGSDRSPSLVSIARSRGFEVAVADGLALPFRRGCADFALCIAVIHHLATRDRRVAALRGLLECVRPDGGQVLVYVWALEQTKTSRRAWDTHSAQDQLVPWVMKANQGSSSSSKKKGKTQNKDRDKDKDKPSKAGEAEGEDEGQADVAGTSADADTTYERFYHLYREGELEEDLRAAGGRVMESGYERDNWWVIGDHGENP